MDSPEARRATRASSSSLGGSTPEKGKRRSDRRRRGRGGTGKGDRTQEICLTPALSPA
jgi:hypothetical protein